VVETAAGRGNPLDTAPDDDGLGARVIRGISESTAFSTDGDRSRLDVTLTPE